MAEIEFAGIKFKGGKMVAVAMGLSTLVGGLYGGFEVYKDYMDMKEMIQSYVAPDLSGFQEQLSVIEQKMANTEDAVLQATDYARDIRNDLKDDVSRVEVIVDRIEDRVNDSEKDMREMIDLAEQRFDNKRDQLFQYSDREIKNLESRLNRKIQEALDNPLANQKNPERKVSFSDTLCKRMEMDGILFLGSHRTQS